MTSCCSRCGSASVHVRRSSWTLLIRPREWKMSIAENWPSIFTCAILGVVLEGITMVHRIYRAGYFHWYAMVYELPILCERSSPYSSLTTLPTSLQLPGVLILPDWLISSISITPCSLIVIFDPMTDAVADLV